MIEVQPVAYLVDRGAAEVERRGRGADRAERGVQNHHLVRRRRAGGELRVAEQSVAQRADPEVQSATSGKAGGLKR